MEAEKELDKIKTEIAEAGMHIYHLLILDESGSMQSVKKETITGYNEQVQTIKHLQAKYPTQKHFTSLVLFSSEVKTPLFCVDTTKVDELNDKTYLPNTSTALNDAIGLGCTALEEHLKTVTEKYKVLVTILTDGEENCSKAFTHTQAADTIKRLTATTDWAFSFLGCGADTILTAKSYHISAGSAMAYTAGASGTKAAFSKMSSARGKFVMSYSDDSVSLGVSSSVVTDNLFDDATDKIADAVLKNTPPNDPLNPTI